jgi:hypothetical protein
MTKSDFYIIFLSILLAAGIYLLHNIKKKPIETLIVRHSGKIVLNVMLPDNRFVDVSDEKNNWILEIQGLKVRVSHSDCPKKFCIKQSWINKNNISLICAPQRYQAELKGLYNESIVDVVTR